MHFVQRHSLRHTSLKSKTVSMSAILKRFVKKILAKFQRKTLVGTPNSSKLYSDNSICDNSNKLVLSVICVVLAAAGVHLAVVQR